MCIDTYYIDTYNMGSWKEGADYLIQKGDSEDFAQSEKS